MSGKGRKRWWARAIAVAALASLVLVIGSAWLPHARHLSSGGAISINVPGRGGTPEARSWQGPVPEGWPAPNGDFVIGPRVGVRVSGRVYLDLNTGHTLAEHVTRTGLPFPCMASRTLMNGDPTGQRTSVPLSVWDGGARASWSKLDAGLPVRPVFPQFFWSWSAMFAITLALHMLWIAVGPGAKRRRRIARGRCPACGYDRAGVEGSSCPECGAAPGG